VATGLPAECDHSFGDIASEGRAAIESVAEEVGWSSKHLIAMFKKQIGLPPKAVARILRFPALFAV
jgi:methylphosphotriester-DNA--protein-cysteine methyltransferase